MVVRATVLYCKENGSAKLRIYNQMYTSPSSERVWALARGFMLIIQCVLTKTGPLQLISHNFTNSQCSLIIFGA